MGEGEGEGGRRLREPLARRGVNKKILSPPARGGESYFLCNSGGHYLIQAWFRVTEKRLFQNFPNNCLTNQKRAL